MFEQLLVSKANKKGWNQSEVTINSALMAPFLRAAANGGFRNGKFFSFGGYQGDSIVRSVNVKTGEVKDEFSYTSWQGMACAAAGDELVFMGGQTGSTSGTAMNYVMGLNTLDNTIKQGGLPVNTTYCHATVLENGKIFCFTGRPGDKYVCTREPFETAVLTDTSDCGFDSYGACSFVHEGEIYVFNADVGLNMRRYDQTTKKLIPHSTIQRNDNFRGFYLSNAFTFAEGMIYYRNGGKFGRFDPFSDFEEVIWENPMLNSSGYVGYQDGVFYTPVGTGIWSFKFQG